LGKPHMIQEIEKVFGEKVSRMREYKTPGTPGFGIVRPKDDSERISAEMQSEYMSGVGMLLYLVKYSRPDIANAVRELTKCMDGATPAAYKEMLRLIKFVLCTKTWGLKIAPKSPDGTMKWNLVSFSDSDWAGDKDNRRSINGFIMFLCGVPIVWRSKQQKTVALSSSEAEFVAISEAVKEILFVLQLLRTMGIPVEIPVKVRVDNMGAIFMSENASSGIRTRHVDTRYHFVREQVADKIVEIIFVRTDDNKADGFTKNVKGEVFERHSRDFVWRREYCRNASLAYQIEEEEDRDSVLRVKHWASVGRVLEVSLDSSTDARPFTDERARLRLARIEDPTFNVSRSSAPSSASLQGVRGEDPADLHLNFETTNFRS